MKALSNTAHLFATVTCCCEEIQRTSKRIVASARIAQKRGATAETYHLRALELERQTRSAEKLLFGQAAETFRVAAAENQLIADALEAIEGRTNTS